MLQILVPQPPSALLNDCRLARPLVQPPFAPQLTAGPSGQLRPHPQLRTLPLDAQHVVAFVPSLSQVAVLNQAALNLLGRLPLGATDDEDEQAALAGPLAAMGALGLLVTTPEAGIPPPPPPSVLSAWLHLTNACNLDCSYCYIQKSAVGMDRATARQAVDAVVAAALRHGYREVALKYAGGEPLLALDTLAATHSYAQERCAAAGLALQATVLTNGMLLSTARLARLRALGLALTVSLDGLAASNDRQRPDQRGRATAAVVLAGIERAAAAGLAPGVAITVTGTSIDGAPELVAWLLERELAFTLSFYREHDCGRDRSALMVEEQQIIAGMRTIYALIEARPPRWSVLGALLDRADLSHAHGRACAAGQDYMVIDHLGRVAACQMALDQPVADLTHSDPLGAIRLDARLPLGLPVEQKAGCSNCDWRYWCGGGCPIATLRATGRSDVKSPHCAIYLALFPDLLRLEGRRLLHWGA
jgi:uncharacterized protein